MFMACVDVDTGNCSRCSALGLVRRTCSKVDTEWLRGIGTTVGC